MTDDVAVTHPIAGSKPRGADPAEDAALETELLNDPKERAEHVMLVDLGRNDLGRVCVPGTVEVIEFMEVRRYSHIMHLESTVRGRVRPGQDALDVVLAAFPAGTLSGAPKVRAMEIIDELEVSRRGLYGGRRRLPRLRRRRRRRHRDPDGAAPRRRRLRPVRRRDRGRLRPADRGPGVAEQGGGGGPGDRGRAVLPAIEPAAPTVGVAGMTRCPAPIRLAAGPACSVCSRRPGCWPLVASAQPWWRAVGRRTPASAADGGHLQRDRRDRWSQPGAGGGGPGGSPAEPGAGRRGRRVLAVLLAVAGLGVVVLGGLARCRRVTLAVRTRFRQVSLVEQFVLEGTAWPWIYALAGVGVVVGAALLWTVSPRWPSGDNASSDPSRADPSPPDGEPRHRPAADPAEAWRALDAGVDPTVGADDDHLTIRATGDARTTTPMCASAPQQTQWLQGRLQGRSQGSIQSDPETAGRIHGRDSVGGTAPPIAAAE